MTLLIQENDFKGNLIYADVVASAGPIATQIFLDDDRVEYAEIEQCRHNTIGDSAIKETSNNPPSRLLGDLLFQMFYKVYYDSNNTCACAP